jgi:hypothetical protein
VDIVGDKFSVETIQGSPFFSVAKKTGGWYQGSPPFYLGQETQSYDRELCTAPALQKLTTPWVA